MSAKPALVLLEPCPDHGKDDGKKDHRDTGFGLKASL